MCEWCVQRQCKREEELGVSALSFEEFFHRYVVGVSKKANIEELTNKIHEIPKELKEAASQASDALDKHMVWLAGGGLYLVNSIFLQDRSYCLPIILSAALILFALCVMFVISSYRFAVSSLEQVPRIHKIAPKFLQALFDFKGGRARKEVPEKVWYEAEESWHRMAHLHKTSLRYVRLTGFCNWAAYLSFILAVVAVLAFGILNLPTPFEVVKEFCRAYPVPGIS